jgi:cell pole-organizing protein PopZ
MTQAAKSHEPSMEEILASIRRIIADDDVKPEAAAAAPPAPPAQPKAPPAAAKPAPAPPPKPAPVAKVPEPKPAPPPAANPNNQDDIDALLAGLDADTSEAEVRGAGEPAAPEAAEDDVLELTEQMEVDEEEPKSFKTLQPNDDIEFSEAELRPAEPRAQARAHVPVPPPVRTVEESEPVQPQQPLMSQQTATAVNSAFNTLAQTVLSNNARTLEDLVKEMLRPMLRSWLDDNLPGLVEKIVRAEIERVSRGR